MIIEDTKNWDKKDFVYGIDSVREMPIGYVKSGTNWKLFDKFLCVPNFCYFCNSNNTFHKRQQGLGDKVGNVWRSDLQKYKDSYVTRKWDFCLDCGKEILFEYLIFIKNDN